ncbi:hypothetical protein EON64_11825, partial [archaeon]
MKCDCYEEDELETRGTQIAHYLFGWKSKNFYNILQWVQKSKLAVHDVELDIEVKVIQDFCKDHDAAQFPFVTSVHLHLRKENASRGIKLSLPIRTLFHMFPMLKSLEIHCVVDDFQLLEINEYINLVPHLDDIQLMQSAKTSASSKAVLYEGIGDKITSMEYTSKSDLVQLVKHCPNLTMIYLSEHVTLKQFLTRVIKFPKLKSLAFTGLGHVSFMGESFMVKLATSLPNLVSCIAKDQPLKLGVHLLSHCPLLESYAAGSIYWSKLVIGGVSQTLIRVFSLHPSLLEDMAALLSKVPPVTQVAQLPPSENVVTRFCEVLGYHKQHVSFVKVYIRIMSNEADFCAKLFKSCPNIMFFYLDNGYCGDELHSCVMRSDDTVGAMQSIAEFGKSLTTFAVRNVPNVRSRDVVHLVQQLPLLTKLHISSMRDMRVGKHLFSAMKGRVWDEFKVSCTDFEWQEFRHAVKRGDLQVKRLLVEEEDACGVGELEIEEIGYGRMPIRLEDVVTERHLGEYDEKNEEGSMPELVSLDGSAREDGEDGDNDEGEEESEESEWEDIGEDDEEDDEENSDYDEDGDYYDEDEEYKEGSDEEGELPHMLPSIDTPFGTVQVMAVPIGVSG